MPFQFLWNYLANLTNLFFFPIFSIWEWRDAAWLFSYGHRNDDNGEWPEWLPQCPRKNWLSQRQILSWPIVSGILWQPLWSLLVFIIAMSVWKQPRCVLQFANAENTFHLALLTNSFFSLFSIWEWRNTARLFSYGHRNDDNGEWPEWLPQYPRNNWSRQNLPMW